MNKNVFIIMVCLLLGYGSNVMAANGEILYRSKSCQTCHGADGNTPPLPTYPKLAGQNAAYLAQQIMDIRDSKRTNGLSSIMKPLIVNLRDSEIQAISDWLAELN